MPVLYAQVAFVWTAVQHTVLRTTSYLGASVITTATYRLMVLRSQRDQNCGRWTDNVQSPDSRVSRALLLQLPGTTTTTTATTTATSVMNCAGGQACSRRLTTRYCVTRLLEVSHSLHAAAATADPQVGRFCCFAQG